MRKLFLSLALIVVPITACATTFNPFAAPAPLAKSSVDEKTLIVALQTFDTVLTAVDKLIEVKVITPGSPRALQIADAIHRGKAAFMAADAARKAGSTDSYFTALAQAQVAVAQINVLIKG